MNYHAAKKMVMLAIKDGHVSHRTSCMTSLRAVAHPTDIFKPQITQINADFLFFARMIAADFAHIHSL